MLYKYTVNSFLDSLITRISIGNIVIVPNKYKAWLGAPRFAVLGLRVVG